MDNLEYEQIYPGFNPDKRRRSAGLHNGKMHYELKTPWRNGTTHVIFEPVDFISRLVALVPRPRVSLLCGPQPF